MDGKCPCICIMSDKKDPLAALAASGEALTGNQVSNSASNSFIAG